MIRRLCIFLVPVLLLTACDRSHTTLQLTVEVKPEGASLLPELDRLARLSMGRRWKSAKTSVDGRKVTMKLGKIRRGFDQYRLLLRTLEKIRAAAGPHTVPRYQLNLAETNPSILEVLRLNNNTRRQFPYVLNTDSVHFAYEYRNAGSLRRAWCQVRARTVGHVPSLRYIRTLRGSRFSSTNRLLRLKHFYAKHTTGINIKQTEYQQLTKLIRYNRKDHVTFDFGHFRLSGTNPRRKITVTDDRRCRHAILLDSYLAFYRSVLFPELSKRLIRYRIRVGY